MLPFVVRSEHERHSPQCPFVKGEFTQNVPLSGRSNCMKLIIIYDYLCSSCNYKACLSVSKVPEIVTQLTQHLIMSVRVHDSILGLGMELTKMAKISRWCLVIMI